MVQVRHLLHTAAVLQTQASEMRNHRSPQVAMAAVLQQTTGLGLQPVVTDLAPEGDMVEIVALGKIALARGLNLADPGMDLVDMADLGAVRREELQGKPLLSSMFSWLSV